jgi:uncharacterized surface protein with fasciclin (FAS1) repeats
MNYPFFSLKLVALASLLGVSLSTAALASPQASEMRSTTALLAQTTETPTTEAATATEDIVDVASSNENFSTLVAAVKAANLVDALKASGPLTVFAPTNAAFAELPAGVVDALLLPKNQDILVQILKYHVVPGKVTSSDLKTGTIGSLNGGLAIKVTPERVIINNGSVIQADVEASNGVIHAINRVLIPQGVAAELQARMASSSTSQPIQALW